MPMSEHLRFSALYRHSVDVRPAVKTSAERTKNLETIIDYFAKKLRSWTPICLGVQPICFRIATLRLVCDQP